MLGAPSACPAWPIATRVRLLQEVEARRSLPRGVRLFAEGELGELAAAARGAGLGDLLAAVLKLPAAPGP